VLPDVRRTADIVFGPARVVVEVRGCFWHGCPLHATSPKANADWWREKIERNQARDTDTDARLRAAGWTLMVIWEHEDPAQAAEHIEALVRNARQREGAR
jgi:DNA mismatch endonuclease (patch repair protein)